jgi:hypothetical protein
VSPALRIVVCSWVLCGIPATARADAPPAAPDPVRLDYDHGAGGASCPAESFFRDVVAAHLGGHDPFTPEAPRRVTLTIRREGRAFAAVAVLYGADGKRLGARELADRDCTSLVDTMGTVVTGWLRPLVLPEPAAPSASPRSRDAGPIFREPDVATPAPTPPAITPPAARPRLVVEAGPLVSFGTLPAPAFGLAAGVGVRWPMFSLALEVRADLPASTELGGRTRVRETLIVGSAAPCFHAGWFVGCGLVAGGALVGEWTGTSGARQASPYVAAGARLGVEVPITPRFALRGSGDVLVPVSRRPVAVEKFDGWTPPPAGFALGARLVISF